MSAVNTDIDLISQILEPLERCGPDEYLIAFGPDSKQFVGTPNGYSATFFPPRPFAELANGVIEKVLWASFGSTPESWFFSYQFKNGSIGTRLGEGSPKALRKYIDTISTNKQLLGALRVQLGHADSFLAWSVSAWACYNVPGVLHAHLCQLSSGTRNYNGVTMGSFKKGTLVNAQWHNDGSFYVKGSRGQAWNFQSVVMRDAWRSLWQGVEDGMMDPQHLAQVAYVAIDAHAATCETFVMIKKKEFGHEAPFILRIGQEPVHVNISTADQRLQHLASLADDTHFQWAVSLKSGRPHQHAAELDTWELELKKGQRVKVLKDLGKDWYLVAGKKDIKGYVHGSWLDFKDHRFHEDPKTGWARFSDATRKILEKGQVSEFPCIRDYVDVCTKEGCKAVKDDPSSLGICAHDLMVLLEGSGCYALEWIKDSRNMWHPDKFARYCMPEHADRLKVLAQQLFVLYGVLMEAC